MKKIAVLFSGGLDSTYLVYKNLMKGNIVVPAYMEILNNHNKSAAEKQQIEKLWKVFDNQFPGMIKNIRYPISARADNSKSNLVFVQIPIFLIGSLYCMGKDIHEMQIGYIMNDDAVSYIDDFTRAWEGLKGLAGDEELPPLTFPLMKYNKTQIADLLPIRYKELTFSCENPKTVDVKNKEKVKYKACGKCAACIRQNNEGILT